MSLGKLNQKHLHATWNVNFDWEEFPRDLVQGCHTVSSLLCVPAEAVLYSLITCSAFAVSHATVTPPNTKWHENVVLWTTVCLPTGAGKSTLCGWIRDLMTDVHDKMVNNTPFTEYWGTDEVTFPKLGEIMSQNGNRDLQVKDELTSFLSQLGIYNSKAGMLDTPEASMMLQLYNGNGWTRQTVMGNSNFRMNKTALDLLGFSQPEVMYSIMSQHLNIERGLSSRFLLVVPKPTLGNYQSLKVDGGDGRKEAYDAFRDLLVNALCKVMRCSRKQQSQSQEYVIEEGPGQALERTYDEFQSVIKKLMLGDNLMCSLYSKGKGQILRVSAALWLLFYAVNNPDRVYSDDEELALPQLIPEEVVKAAISVVQFSITQTGLLHGRKFDSSTGLIESFAPADDNVISTGKQSECESPLSSHILKEPGRVLSVSTLLKKRRFKEKGKKDVVETLENLQNNLLGKVRVFSSRGGKRIFFEKTDVISMPDDVRPTAIVALANSGVSLQQLSASFVDSDAEMEMLHLSMQDSQSAPKRKSLEAERDLDSTVSDDDFESPPKRKSL